jgi:xanthine dehydrogenase molybdenum-binding subunit
VASLLGLPEDKVRGTLASSGGAFGAKEDLNVQGHAALLAWHTRRPVKLTLSRAESLRFHVKRHPLTMTYTAGCDERGRLLGLRARIVGDTGAYASVGDKVLERAAGHACGPYRVPAADVEARPVYTNNVPCGAMRGFGVSQVNFALEGVLDQLAERAGLDGWDIRWLNAPRPAHLRIGPAAGHRRR